MHMICSSIMSIPLLYFFCQLSLSSTRWCQNFILQMQGSYELNMPGHPEEIKMGGNRLILMKKPAKSWYSCNGCRERDMRPCYKHADGNRNHHLHKECYDSFCCEKSSIMYNLSSTRSYCDYIFHKEALGCKGVCDACGDDVKGWFYRCKTCKKPHYLHPCCAKLPIKKYVNTRDGEIIIDLKSERPSNCLICGNKKNSEGFSGWYYISRCGKYCYHWSCMKYMALNMWNKDGDQWNRNWGHKTEMSSEAMKTMNQNLVTRQHPTHGYQKPGNEMGKKNESLLGRDQILDSGNRKQGGGAGTKSQAMLSSQDRKKYPVEKAMCHIKEMAVELLNVFIPLIFGLPPLPLGLVLKFLK